MARFAQSPCLFLHGALAAALALAAGCGPSQTVSPAPTPVGPGPDPAPGDSGEPAPSNPVAREVSLADVGLDPAALDKAADPCADFYQFACGGWLAKNEIPEDKSRYGRIAELTERNEQTLKEILEAARSNPGADPAAAKLGAFYGACMDEPAIEKAGLTGVQPLLDRARRARNAGDVLAAIAELHRHGIWAVFGAEAEADFKDSRQMILFLDTDGLGLPDRDYYLKDEFAKARAFYRGHVTRTFQLLGMRKPAAKRAAADVIRIETELAKVTKTKVQRRDVAGLYNKIDRAGLQKLAPRMRWDAYFQALGRPELKAISVTTPDYFARVDKLIRRIKPRAWGNYLQWQIAHHLAAALPAKHVDEAFALRSELSGQPALEPRWKRCVGATNAALGELLGQRFIAERFAGESKRAAQTMVREIARAFAAELDGLPWMDAQTRAQAKAKLSKMSNLIGYPDKWKQYPFEIDAAVYARSVLRAQAHETQRELAKAGEPYDRTEWRMNPQRVNAYYNPLANQMAFPAGILQPPFFGADRAVAVNLGAMGMIVGHELTHGFDDTGAQFDGDGNLTNWWQPADAEKFKAKGECLIKQYAGYEPVPGLHLNGELTLGENIADLGGVKLAFRAYRNLRRDARQRDKAEGLTEDQQFFVAVGQAWCSKTRKAELERRVVVDSHSPPRFRVNGVLVNLPEFAEAFSCQAGARMHPKDTCQVW